MKNGVKMQTSTAIEKVIDECWIVTENRLVDAIDAD